MATFSVLGIGLSFVCGCVLLGFAAEVYYLLWWKKRRVDIENKHLSFSSSSSSNYAPTHISSYISCWKNANSSIPPKTQDNQQVPEMRLDEDLVLKGSGEESLDLELMRLHNLCGPPRFLTTINEETKEDFEPESRRGSRAGSLSDHLVTMEAPFLSPQASPPLKGPELQSVEGYHHSGLNPLFETDINGLRSSPPPTFKFLRDAEEKLLRRLMQLEGEKGVDYSAKMEEKDGPFVKLVGSKGKNGGIQQHHPSSAPSKVLPLASSPSNNHSN